MDQAALRATLNLRNGQCVSILKSWLMTAAEGGHHETIVQLLQHLEDHASKNQYSRIVCDALYISAIRGHAAAVGVLTTVLLEKATWEEAVKVLLKGLEGSASGGYTDLTFRAELGATSKEEYRSRQYDNVRNARVTSGYTSALENLLQPLKTLALKEQYQDGLKRAFYSSAKVGYGEAVELLLKHITSDLDKGEIVECLLNALEASAAAGKFELLSDSELLKEEYTDGLENLLLDAKTNGGFISVVKQLLGKFTDIASKDECISGLYEPLCISAKAGYLETAELFLDAFTVRTKTVEHRNKLRRAFITSVQGGNSDVVLLFLEKGEGFFTEDKMQKGILDALKASANEYPDIYDLFMGIAIDRKFDIYKSFTPGTAIVSDGPVIGHNTLLLCAICNELFNEGAKKLLCGHVYCSDINCIDRWLQEKKSCPECNGRARANVHLVTLYEFADCAICTVPFRGYGKRLPCGHFYCLASACNARWLRDKSCSQCS